MDEKIFPQSQPSCPNIQWSWYEYIIYDCNYFDKKTITRNRHGWENCPPVSTLISKSATCSNAFSTSSGEIGDDDDEEVDDDGDDVTTEEEKDAAKDEEDADDDVDAM